MTRLNEEEQEVREETKILVIEDDPDVRFIVKETLKKIGYEIQAVGTGLEGPEGREVPPSHREPGWEARRPSGRCAR